MSFITIHANGGQDVVTIDDSERSCEALLHTVAESFEKQGGFWLDHDDKLRWIPATTFIECNISGELAKHVPGVISQQKDGEWAAKPWNDVTE